MQTLAKSEYVLLILNLFAKKVIILFIAALKQPALFRIANNVKIIFTQSINILTITIKLIFVTIAFGIIFLRNSKINKSCIGKIISNDIKQTKCMRISIKTDNKKS